MDFDVIGNHWAGILYMSDCAWEFSTKVRQLFVDFMTANDLDRGEVCTVFSCSCDGLISMYLNETYNKVRISKHLTDRPMFLVENCLKLGDPFLTFL